MTILTPELRQALEQNAGAPLRLTDPETNTAYVVVRADLYDRVRALLEPEDDFDISETYPAQMESAMRAGWDDPAMDDYNDYDAHRGQS